MHNLIDGIPDAVALQCLARVPFCYHPQLQLVCQSWKTVVRSPEINKARQEVGATEEFLCVLAFEPENIWQLYDPRRDLWMTLPMLPSEIRHLARVGVASVDGKLFVLGGGSDKVDPSTGDHDGIFATNEVWCYDPLLQKWSQKASMLLPRAMFACCALNGKIVVAGGFTNPRETISDAEIYDAAKDIWYPLPDLCHTRNSACSGITVDGKIHVFHKGLSMVQILDEKARCWAVADNGWLQGPMTIIHDELYVLSYGLILKQKRDNPQRITVASASEFQSRIGFGMMGLGDDLYMVGGVIGPGPMNQCIKPLSDVDVITIGSDRPIWRSVTPMTRCRGSVLGCSLLRL